MSVPDAPKLYDAARAARRAVVDRWRGKFQLPRLRVDRSVTRPPAVWMICPDWNRPAGGLRKQYRTVDILNAADVPAAIVHRRPGFECTWFAHATKVVAATDVVVAPHDLIVVPEMYGPAIRDLPAGVRQVIFNQNGYLTLDSLAVGDPAAAPYVGNPDLAAVLVVSEENADLLGYAFPGAPIRRVRPGIDPAVYHPPEGPKRRQIAYMPRKRKEEAAQVMRLLEMRGALEGWEAVSIYGYSETETADIFRASPVFLSFSDREGLGLPPLEALACGCLVVGFDGFAGREFFRAPFAESVENGDVFAFARAAESLLRRVDADPAAAVTAATTGVRFVRERYSLEIERQDLVDVFTSLLSN